MTSKVDLSNYIHTYKAYRVPKGTAVKNVAGEEVVLSEEKDTLVLTAASSRQLVQDRRKLGEALTNEINEKCEKSQEKAWEKYAKDQAKVMAVFRSMSKGHIVSPMDESKLMDNIVEIDSSGVDFSDFKTMGLGGVVGEFIDLSV